ncbi:MAG: hypothetical protein K6C99_08195 [Lachnospiraceae bacterium]|nr:hypothetical protein [Lachnospiraceae bacterium]
MNKGSLTLEAAFLMPLYTFFMVSLLSFFEILHLEQNVDFYLSRAAKEMALYSPAGDILSEGEEEIDDGFAETVISDIYSYGVLTDNIPQAYRTQCGMKGDFIFLPTDNVEDVIDLSASYSATPGANVFMIPDIGLIGRARTRAWTGFNTGAGSGPAPEERMVYVTEKGEVYHLSRSCSHLSLSVHSIDEGSQDSYRNSSGGKYKCCEVCGSGKACGEYFITDDGDRYHTDINCPGLKRTIYEIPLSEVGDRRVCSRCSGAYGE